jgi:hypothetical protein
VPRTSSAPQLQVSGNGSPRPSSQPERLGRLEAAVTLIQHTLDVQFKRIADLQAEMDRLKASK